MATIKEVAKAAGVSVMTASRVARGMEGVRESTRKNVLEVMKNLGYQPNRLARALRNNHSNTIGIVVADVKNSFYMQVNALIEQRLRAKGFSVLVSFSNEDMEMEMSGLSMLWGARVDGIIITPVHRNDTQVSDFLQNHDLPVLQLYRNVYDQIDSLSIDDRYGVKLATRRLLEEGHRRILLLDVNWEGRADGYRAAFVEHGLAVDERFILSFGTDAFVEDEVMENINRLHPTAIVAGTNILGYATITACHKLMIEIPQDMSVIIQDDIPWVSLMDITAISQPMNRIAQESVDIILKKIMDKDEQAKDTVIHKYIRPSLIERASVVSLGSKQ